MDKINVLFIDPQQLRYDYGLIANMQCNVTFCCRDKYDEPGIESVKLKKYFRYHLYQSRLMKFLSYSFSLLKILIYVITNKPDVIHIQWWRIWHLDYALLFFLKPFTKKIVFTAHNTLPHDSGISMKKKCIKYYNRVDNIIVHAQNTKTELIVDFGIDGSKIQVIKHGLMKIHVDETEVKSIISHTMKQYSLESKLIFTLLGNQNKYKGFDLVEEVWCSTPELYNNSDIVLFIAGKSRTVNTERLKRLSNVIIIDRLLTDEEFMAYTDMSSVVLLPYTKISQSGILLTAIEREAPVLVSNIGGLSEPFEYAKIGWNIGSPTPDNMRTALLEIITNSAEPKSVKNDNDGWLNVKNAYSWAEIAKQTEILYKDSIQI